MAEPTVGNHWQEHEAGYKVFVGSIEKPDLDQRGYRILELKNGLKAVLVHDPLADKSAACLRIAVGSLHDPPDMYGTAHFCEHMITKGTRLFPAENDFVSFVKVNGGIRNAGTSPSYTNYWFSIAPSSLLGAISRMAAFFECPLFTPNVVTREINAVDSENKKNLQDDSRRVLQVERSLSAPGHPWLAFSTGNIDSLTSAARKRAIDEKWDSDTISPDGDGGPVGRETRRRLIEWVEQQYCSGRMTLAVLGRESLETLTEVTTRLFSSIPNRGLVSRPLITNDPWTEGQQKCTIFVKTTKDTYGFKLTFPVPNQSPQYLTKPANFLAHLIGHEGPGGVFSHLKNKGWLLSISVEPQTWNRGVQLFVISGRFTHSGYCNHLKTIQAIFSYISLLKMSISSLPRYFEEFKELSEIFFRKREKSQPHTYVISLTARLEEDSPTQWLLNADLLYREYSERAVKNVLDCLLPEKARLTLSAKNHEAPTEGNQIIWRKEKWYGTEYAIQEFGPEVFEQPAVLQELHLPDLNPFIPKTLEVARNGVSMVPTSPTRILETDSVSLWHKRDNTFWVPKGHVRVVLKFPLAEATPRHAVLTRIVANLVDDSLDEVTYSASLAGLRHSLGYHSEGISFRVYGYHDKLPLLLQIVLEKIKHLQPKEDRLKVFKEKATRDYRNSFLQKPVDRAGYYAKYFIDALHWTPEEKLVEVTGITLEDVQSHHAKLLSRMFVETLVTGNFTDKGAISLALLVKEQLQYQALPPAERPVPKSLIIPIGKRYTHRMLVTDAEELNCGLALDFHFGDNADQGLRRKVDLLRHLIDEPAFSTLRTREQLGYIVATLRWTSVGTTVLRFRIQSREDPVFLEERIELFLGSFYEKLKAMPDGDFNIRRNGLIVKKLEKVKNLAEETEYYWNQIRSGYYDFSQDETDAGALETVTKTQILEVYETYLLQTGSSRRNLAVHMISRRLQVSFPLPEGTTEIIDVRAFKASLASTSGATPVTQHASRIIDSRT